MNALATVALLGLASYRATQLVVWDSIGDPLRQRLELWHAKRIGSRFRTFVRDLLSCIYCTGWWLSMVAYATYVTGSGSWGDRPLLVHAAHAWAVTGTQALLNRLDDSLPGHHPKGP